MKYSVSLHRATYEYTTVIVDAENEIVAQIKAKNTNVYDTISM